ncbi:MAG: hypothetical protein QOE79_1573 [Sphingomonadales bacterium]|nr:hypothetical protein [Sphingomonadales bacterium]
MKRGGGALLSLQSPSTMLRMVPLPIGCADREDSDYTSQTRIWEGSGLGALGSNWAK